MGLEFCSFASGSSGNCYLVRSDSTSLLVDVGIAGKHILSGLKKCGMEAPDVDGILLTHEHTDHVKSIRMMGRKASNAEIYSTAGTLDCVRDKLPEDRATAIDRNQHFTVGNIEIQAFPISHDAADPVAYTFRCDGRMLSIMTDTGIVTDEMFQHIQPSDTAVLEANHEVNILRVGPYPYPLKQRILGDHGHLSNETAGNTVCRLLEEHKSDHMPRIVLAHLSHQNNTPEQAFLTVRNILFEDDYYVGKDLNLSVARRSEPTPLLTV
ncbi:MAG: MBL fold metallo-hydrolase [Eubacterium sp.]|jgi:phosphoribosyl 1,2-cyclic phosphodiesterase|uniref:MBL fold metallo-hydrolase n=1 Tax=Eubacterium sp. F2 TaxID=3381348 RepID=UPI0039080C56|nr:MBL fold metallo-hydrolase [Eubacterium sp.]MCI2196916.1 MBL fold metallo-hydrolase [Eubacterium sp.]